MGYRAKPLLIFKLVHHMPSEDLVEKSDICQEVFLPIDHTYLEVGVGVGGRECSSDLGSAGN